ncbi:DUF2780 domain-containing protein [Psychromonas sp. KJ10-10]|uniref:DUF2780 domain-containing protein n=1 Tax=Psychromonas sp. KJ10-10 TaxID=3391823 RepID=UPI0039B4F5C5
MKKQILATTLLISLTSVANAGFFDSIFGGEETTPATVKAEVENVVPSVETEKSSMTSTATSMATGLLPTLTQQLGVSDAQASGGLGSLMQLAQSSLSTDEFSQLSDGVPNMSSLLSAVPALTSSSDGGLTNMLSQAGGVASSLGGLSLLTQQFEALGLSPDMISQFAQIAMTYFSSDNGTSALLQKGLASVLG